jgi:hypothetical protein
MLVDSEDGWPLSEDVNSSSKEASNIEGSEMEEAKSAEEEEAEIAPEMEEAEEDSEEAEITPRPREKGNQDLFHRILDLSADDESEPFQSPLVLRQKKRVVVNGDLEETPKVTVKRKKDQVEGKKSNQKEIEGSDGKKLVRVN